MTRRLTFAICLAGAAVVGTPAAAGFLDQLFGGFIRRVQPRIERALPALDANDHHVSNTARELQLERSHLYKKMRALGIDPRSDEPE